MRWVSKLIVPEVVRIRLAMVGVPLMAVRVPLTELSPTWRGAVPVTLDPAASWRVASSTRLPTVTEMVPWLVKTPCFNVAAAAARWLFGWCRC